MRSAQHAKTHRDDTRKDGSSLHQATYRLDPPLDLTPYQLDGVASHVLISTSIDPRRGIRETIVAPATSHNQTRVTTDLTRTPPTSDAQALERLGYALTLGRD